MPIIAAGRRLRHDGRMMPTGVRRILNNAADRALATRHARHRTDTTT